MKITKEDLKKLSKETHLNISEKYLNVIYENFFAIEKQLKKVKNLNINIKPLNMIYEDEFETFLREDNNANYLTKKETLKNAKNKNNNYIWIKR